MCGVAADFPGSLDTPSDRKGNGGTRFHRQIVSELHRLPHQGDFSPTGVSKYKLHRVRGRCRAHARSNVVFIGRRAQSKRACSGLARFERDRSIVASHHQYVSLPTPVILPRVQRTRPRVSNTGKLRHRNAEGKCTHAHHVALFAHSPSDFSRVLTYWLSVKLRRLRAVFPLLRSDASTA